MENKFMRVEEVAAELGVSASYAYKVIRRLNDELKAKAAAYELLFKAACMG